ncbi:N-acetylglucosamine-6-phosphate deacetylase [Flavisolibacter ginsenosidimutans]|nr:N-acetylglucosamine-6-phosphate deacetylase [Flavisolibacter ginsenosidimutans]
MITALTNGILFTGTERIENKALLFDEEGIREIVGNNKIPTDATIIDCKGVYVAPGLIDLQIYGAGGYLFSAKPSAEALQAITDAIVQSGTTSFLLTLATNSVPIYRDAIHTVRYNPHPALLGLHLEGPYINQEKKGAHLEEFIKVPTTEEVEAMCDEAQGILKMVTLAPEVTDPSVIRLLVNNGVIVSAGHSNATYEEGLKGFEAGIQTVTHFFNAMSSLHHRATGLPGATAVANVYASIIADGIHVDYSTVVLSKKMLGEKLFLITDAVEESSEGPYLHVKTEDRFTLPDGTLSGSKLTLLQAVKNCVQHCSIPLDEALRMASTYPANLLGTQDLGRFEAGAKANILLFDEDFNVLGVYLEGKNQQ